VLVAFSHRRPDVLVYCAESEIDKSLVVENAGLRLEFTARSITIVHKGADGLSLGPCFFVEFSVEVIRNKNIGQPRHEDAQFLMASGIGGRVRMLAHGTTLHGAQAQDPRWACQPLVYYAPTTPIGQVFTALQLEKPAIRVGAVGLGTGSVAAYVRASDRLTFFEIDPLVVRISTDPEHFSYTTRCAAGPIDYVIGDARLTVAQQPRDQYDILLIDAFSSDAVPAHLLTVEAVRGYLTHVKADGVLILHLSNRNLDLKAPAQAVAKAAGGVAMIQEYRPDAAVRAQWASAEDAVIVGRSAAALKRFAADRRWTPADPTKVRPWTDDYTNLAGALYRRTKEKFSLSPDAER